MWWLTSDLLRAAVAGTVYIAPYIITTPELLRSNRREAEQRTGWAPTDIAEGFMAAVQAGEWRYDPSDDPSFYSARHLHGSLSWGICRRNLRNPLRKGDVVAFIGFEERDSLVTYRFCAYATVADKVTPCAIWNDDDLAVYQRYLNLLAQPMDGGFEHYEPHPGGTHEDWLWRMTERRGNGWKREDFDEYDDPKGGMTVRLGSDRAGGKPVRLAKNYVIFERDYPKTFVVDDPLPVADRKRGDRYESWRTDRFATAIREITLGRSSRETLYDRGEEDHFRPNPHTHVRLHGEVHAESWRDDASALLERFGGQSLT